MSKYRSVATAVAAGVTVPALLTTSSLAQLQFQDQTSTRFPQPNLNEYTNQASIVDLDNDNDLDMVFANGQGFSSAGVALRLRMFINNGSGVFTEESQTRVAAVTGWFRGVEFGDCDRDGDWDMVLVQDFNKQPQLWLNDGNGFFSNVTASNLPVQNLSSSRAQFGDIDNDGDLDLVLCNSGTVNRFGTGQPKMYINDGNGKYTDGTVGHLPAQTITDQQDVIFGDIDGDLDLDAHLGSRAGQSKLWINDGAGAYTALAGFPGGGNSYSYDFGDINGDGDLDLLGVNGGSELLLRNDTPITTWATISSEISPNTAIDDNDSKFFDYDNDGDLDFIIGSLGSVERIYRNNGQVATADFTQVTGLITTVGDSTMDIEVADLTNDGKIDVLTLQGESGSFVDRIYANIGPVGVVDNRAPRIIKTEQVADTSEPGSYVVRAVVYDDYTSDRGFFDKGVFINYSVDGGDVQQVKMDWSGNSLWRGEIPGVCNGVIEYSISATDWNNNVGVGDPLTFTVTGTPNPPDITGDTFVGIDDLFEVINQWGACEAKTPCTADLDCSNDVGIDDLFIVLANWSV